MIESGQKIDPGIHSNLFQVRQIKKKKMPHRPGTSWATKSIPEEKSSLHISNRAERS
jgi:hypothetical protein